MDLSLVFILELHNPSWIILFWDPSFGAPQSGFLWNLQPLIWIWSDFICAIVPSMRPVACFRQMPNYGEAVGEGGSGGDGTRWILFSLSTASLLLLSLDLSQCFCWRRSKETHSGMGGLQKGKGISIWRLSLSPPPLLVLFQTAKFHWPSRFLLCASPTISISWSFNMWGKVLIIGPQPEAFVAWQAKPLNWLSEQWTALEGRGRGHVTQELKLLCHLALCPPTRMPLLPTYCFCNTHWSLSEGPIGELVDEATQALPPHIPTVDKSLKPLSTENLPKPHAPETPSKLAWSKSRDNWRFCHRPRFRWKNSPHPQFVLILP